VGMRFIGDLQIIEAASEAEPVPYFLDRVGIERNFYFRPANWATFYDHRRVARLIRSAAPYGFFIRRGAEEGTLDRGLLAQARAAGAKVIFDSRIDVGRTLSPPGSAGEPAASHADIVATGPASPDGLAREMTWRTADAGGNFGLSMFVRRASQASDFHRYLGGWHARRWWKALLSPLVRRVWRHDGRCMHKPGEHWCRSRDTEMKVPPLGPV